ncbi:hypothetical protein C448_08114 [Halococcus morrhuae DSM 1307]|uniref:Uncharacterized protein n=1 Tax=Halococcus morrhuae DSM 1307 TaxID=931277 RepID=M0MFW8_HALMO|nr:hypothetical protein C448_08114 [Halococcus morrhuae DSM 1307]
MHVATLPLAQPGAATEDLGGHSFEIHAFGDSHVVRAMRSGYSISIIKMGADAGSGSFLPSGEMQFARDRAGRDIERGLFPFQILLLETLFVVSSRHHPAVHFLQFGIAYHGILRADIALRSHKRD